MFIFKDSMKIYAVDLEIVQVHENSYQWKWKVCVQLIEITI